jgi:hypothetical protein
MVTGSALKRRRHNLAPKVARVFVLTQTMKINPIVGIIAIKFAMCFVAAQFLVTKINQSSATMLKEAIVMVPIQLLFYNHGTVLAANVIVLL